MESCINIISDLGNIVTATAAVAGVVIALFGLRGWRDELHGRADFELARRVMRSVYEVRNRIRQMRTVVSTESFETRYERFNSKAGELDSELFEAEVLWGDTLHGPKESLKERVSTFRLALSDRYDEKNGFELTETRHQELNAICDGYGRKNDRFDEETERTVSEFEEALRPYLKRGK